VGSDSHLQFTNWTLDNNGGYDYAADTRGYTVGAVVEYQDRAWGARAAVALMPRVANGIDLDWNVGRARGENLGRGARLFGRGGWNEGRNDQAYLTLGGHGFLLGDGGLTYGRETIVEAYYTLAAGHGMFGAIGLQRIWNPGYNRDRGPVLVPMLRAHVEF
jgi:hypothetical protein